MKRRWVSVLCVAAPLLVLTATAGAQANGDAKNPFLGSWTMDPDNSTFNPPPGPMERHMIFEMVGDALKHSTLTPTLFAGTNIIEYTAKFDGKDYDIEGSGLDKVSLKRIDPNTIERTGKESGQVSETCTMQVSAAGKKLTVTTKGNFRGTAYGSVQIYYKDK